MEEEKGLTIEKLKKYKAFETISDEEVLEIINGYRRFAHLTYSITR
ncbi:MAG: hypothetical protein K2X86_04485 [Cytophagaceae bacterium]|nr:hypothetical protein [Cytophagaceae bacterium]